MTPTSTSSAKIPSSEISSNSAVAAVVLAAGRGTRMRSELPKVLHPVAGRPMLAWVLDAARAAGCKRLFVVVGHGAEEVKASLGAPDVVWVAQMEQRGTGDALARVESHLEAGATLLVLSGDVPLVSARTLGDLAGLAEESWGAVAVAELEEPGSLGRVRATPSGDLEKVVEAADAGDEDLALRRVNAGIYALPAPEVFGYLSRLTPDNAKGELYLTDALNAAVRAGRRIALHPLADPSEAWGVNDRAELARVHRLLLDRRCAELSAAGVTILEPDRTVIEPGVAVGKDTLIHPGVSLAGETRVGSGCVISQGAWIRDSVLGDGVVVEPYGILDGVRVGDGCRIGPFARLRPATGSGARSLPLPAENPGAPLTE